MTRAEAAIRDKPANIAALLEAQAQAAPERVAVAVAAARGNRWQTTTYGELQRQVEIDQQALDLAGVHAGMRAVLMVKPSVDLFALTFALFRMKAIPVLLDPGMGMKNMLSCLGRVEPSAFIGIPRAHVLRWLAPHSFRNLKCIITVGSRLGFGGQRLLVLRARAAAAPSTALPCAPTSPDDTAAILFTSGSTGPPKGAVYRHETFTAQVAMLAREFEFKPGEVDVATFPLFALFDAALGVTCVVPRMDATRPGSVDASEILRAVADHRATSMFGSPALLERVARGARGQASARAQLATLRRVISAGAPVHRRILEGFGALLDPAAQIHTPYGATEALPVARISSRELLSPEIQERSAQGAGVCVGRPVEGISVRIIKIDDHPIAVWRDDLQVEPGQVGEITVAGAVVTREYFAHPEGTALAKIKEITPSGTRIWHRMGDLGHIDDSGRIWFVGRKSHRVIAAERTLYSVAIEAVFNTIAGVRRTALVGVGARPNQRPVLCVELDRDSPPLCTFDELVDNELRPRARSNAATALIETFIVHPSFPVDIRHNAKIFREQLADWATRRLR